MKHVKFILITSLLLFGAMGLTVNSMASEGELSDPVQNEDGEDLYNIRIEASQWTFKAYDLNKMVRDGVISESDFGDPTLGGIDAQKKAEYVIQHRIESFNKGSTVKFFLYSKDVQHGFSVNELGIAVALNRPGPNADFGEVSQREVEMPNEDVSFSGFCHIFCGLGHPDMKIKLVVGQGEPNYGQFVFIGALALNIGIFGFYFYSILTKLQLVPEET